MKIVKLFDANEIAEATGIRLEDIEDFSNDCAIPWQAKFIDLSEESNNYYGGTVEDRNKITEYLISQGVEEGEVIWIDVTW